MEGRCHRLSICIPFFGTRTTFGIGPFLSCDNAESPNLRMLTDLHVRCPSMNRVIPQGRGIGASATCSRVTM